MLFICPITGVSVRDISNGLFSRLAKTKNLRHLRRWTFLVPYFSWKLLSLLLFFHLSVFPFTLFLLTSFFSLSSCVPFLFFFPLFTYFFHSSLFTYSISSVHRTRCSRLWCHPLANSIYVLLSPGFNSSEQKGFERTVSWKDTILNIGRVLQRKEIPPCRCLRPTHASKRDASCLTKHRRTVV